MQPIKRYKMNGLELYIARDIETAHEICNKTMARVYSKIISFGFNIYDTQPILTSSGNDNTMYFTEDTICARDFFERSILWRAVAIPKTLQRPMINTMREGL